MPSLAVIWLAVTGGWMVREVVSWNMVDWGARKYETTAAVIGIDAARLVESPYVPLPGPVRRVLAALTYLRR